MHGGGSFWSGRCTRIFFACAARFLCKHGRVLCPFRPGAPGPRPSGRTTPDGFKFFRHDSEHSLFELYENRTGPYPAGSQVQYFNPQWLHQQLVAHAEYRMRFADHVYRHFFHDGCLTPQVAAGLLSARRDTIDLAAGDFCLVVADAAAFEAKYAPGLPVAGEYAGRLANGGERIELVDAIGRTIHSFEYQDRWHDSTDGRGRSLVIVNPGNPDMDAWSQESGWRASAALGGSPGR